MQCPSKTATDLPGLDPAQFGVQSARSKWTNLRKPPARASKCQFIEGPTASDQASALVNRLVADKVI
jgi:hypothetical protein